MTSERVTTVATDDLTLRDVRRLRGMTLREVQDVTGINRGTLSKIERGIEFPKPNVILSLSDLYGVLPDSWYHVIEYRCPPEALAA